MNYLALPSSALEPLLDLVLPQDQDPVVVCTDFVYLCELFTKNRVRGAHSS